MIQLTPAEQVLQSLGITAPQDIDIEAIAFDRGAVIKYRSLSGCEARIVGVGDRAVISVSDNVIPARQRFSAAHELGHWHHHRGRSFSCRKEDIGNYQEGSSNPERVADTYAADLLMPRYLFQPLANKAGSVTFEVIDALQAEFKTSITATARRLIDFGAEPAILICHGKMGRRWFKRATSVPARWFPQAELDAESYAMDVLYKPTVKRTRKVVIGADAWFDRSGADRYEIYEQTHKISEDEILTFVTFKDDEMLDD